mmetsp:Transcript_12253/g.26418  ORF Transcript_12253/g.26418 Transcript_12253/m.26418 type:complete len:248 (-) Transcript_12253:964-1707(-)
MKPSGATGLRAEGDLEVVSVPPDAWCLISLAADISSWTPICTYISSVAAPGLGEPGGRMPHLSLPHTLGTTVDRLSALSSSSCTDLWLRCLRITRQLLGVPACATWLMAPVPVLPARLSQSSRCSLARTAADMPIMAGSVSPRLMGEGTGESCADIDAPVWRMPCSDRRCLGTWKLRREVLLVKLLLRVRVATAAAAAAAMQNPEEIDLGDLDEEDEEDGQEQAAQCPVARSDAGSALSNDPMFQPL